MHGTGPPYARWSLIVLILILNGLVGAGSVNRTIDDVDGDSVTGALVQYLPAVPASNGPLWFNQTSCSDCADIPDATFTFDNTWSAAVYTADVGSMSLSMPFTGNAIYVFFVIPNFTAGLASAVLCTFFIDGVAVGNFAHQSDGSGTFAYNTLVYQNTSIPQGDHTLLIETTGADTAVIIFDYVLYTDDIPDPTSSSPPNLPNPPSPSSSAMQMNIESPTSTASLGATDSFTSQSIPPSSTQVNGAPVFPTSTQSQTTPTILPGSIVPFTETYIASGSSTPLSTTSSPFLDPSDNSGTGASQSSSSTPVLPIVGAVVGAIVLIVLALLFYMLYRRRRRQRGPTGTISVFDLLDDNPPSMQSSYRPQLQPPLRPSTQPSPSPSSSPSPSPVPSRRRPLPTPPMSQQHPGRSINATQTKTQMPIHTPASGAGPSGSNFRSAMFDEPSGSGYHSTQSSISVSTYASRSDLHIHIPMTSFRSGQAGSPATLTPSHTPSQSHSYTHSQGHSHNHSHSHAHSPITRNGVPMPPEEADIVRGIVLASLMVDTDSVRRGSEDSAYSPTTETGLDDDSLWGLPVMHVDSGIRISRALMELPPQYAAA